MLRISTAGGRGFATIDRVASIPFVIGIAQSMTTTCGSSCRASAIACAPSLASPITSIAGSSSSMRRKPRRTSAWSSTRSTVILGGTAPLLRTRQRYLQAHQRAPFARPCELDGAAGQRRPLAHRRQAKTASACGRRNPRAVILDLEFEAGGGCAKPDPGLSRSGMSRHVVERFLKDPVYVRRDRRVHGQRGTRAVVGDVDSGLAFDARQVPLYRAV